MKDRGLHHAARLNPSPAMRPYEAFTYNAFDQAILPRKD